MKYSLVSLFVLCLCSVSMALNPPRRPNFIIIMADDLGYADLSCYGNDRYKTPHLDALAKGGLMFTDFHSNGAVCSPTRAALLTGRYQQRAGIPGVVYAATNRPQHRHGLQAVENTFASKLKKVGYATAMFGKWHLGYFPKYNPIHRGFDQFRGYVSGNVDFFSHVDQAGNFDWWIGEKKQQEEGYVTHLITRHSVKFIEDNKDKPFCLYVPHEAPHYPYQGPNDNAEREVGGKFKVLGARKDTSVAYKEMVQEMDKGIGKIVATVRKVGLEHHTWIMFFSDNGATRLGNNGVLRGAKGQVWEGGHRVPCIVYRPGNTAKGETDQLAITMDIMPTILDLAGIKHPTDRKLDGISLADVFRTGRSMGARKLFWHHGNGLAMRDGPWKLVKAAKGFKGVGLFNLSNDLSEKSDLASDLPERTKAMLEKLAAWQKDVAIDATHQPLRETE